MSDYRAGKQYRLSANPINPKGSPMIILSMRQYLNKIITLATTPDIHGIFKIKEDRGEFQWHTRWLEEIENPAQQMEREINAALELEKIRREEETRQRKQKEQEEQVRQQETDRKMEEKKDKEKEEPPAEIKISDTIRTDGILFQKEPAKTLLIACSDGRFHQAVEFLCVDSLFPHENGIDVYYVPGGVGQFNMFRSSLYVDYESHLEDAKMLVLEHGIKTAVLIAHEHCLFYKKKLLEASATQIFNEQVRDLKSAAAKLRELNKEIRIILAYAQVDESSGEIFFQMIE
ncbi:MAG: hypothetical protein V1928_00220 [Parcubacteria group bacterium]